jgi:DNA-binding GntR family transcriptional regulator
MSENSPDSDPRMSDPRTIKAASVEPINARPLHMEVADRLRDLITRGVLSPGEKLNERMLTERFGISRTPLREAIRMLASEGLVRLLPHRGSEVTVITRRDAQDMFEVMAVLEALAGELACRRATESNLQAIARLHEEMRTYYASGDLSEYFRCNQLIHHEIVRSSRNNELADIYERMSVRLGRARYMANFSRDRWDRAMHEHELILEALLARDSERLKRLLGTHLTNKFDSIQSLLPEDADGGAGAEDQAAALT